MIINCASFFYPTPKYQLSLLEFLEKLVKIPKLRSLSIKFGEGNGNPLQYSCLENPMGRGAWWAAVHGIAKSRTRLHFRFSLSCIEEGNGNPLQCSCLENPRDGRAWWAVIYGVTQSWTRLKWLSSSSSSIKLQIFGGAQLVTSWYLQTLSSLGFWDLRLFALLTHHWMCLLIFLGWLSHPSDL